MKLLVSCIPYDSGKSGISAYVREVVRALLVQGHELTLLCEPGVTIDIRQPPPDIGSRLSNIAAPRWTRRPVLSMLWHLLVLPFWIRRHRREFDGFVICAANRRVCAWHPLTTVATIHDLANFHVPGKYSRLRMFYLAHVLPHFAKKAHHLVSVSGATRADMVRFWKCREEDVTVLYNGLVPSAWCLVPSAELKHNDGLESNAPSTRHQALGTILYISRIEHPGKNHVRLIEAYGKLPRALAEAHPLVLAGADWKDADAVHAAAARSPHADLIRFTGFVDDIETVWADAGFYVFPSLFEGFGLSLIEAMARGIPCACSNNGSLGEIAGDVAITFDPESADGMTAALEHLLTEQEQDRAARIARGLEHVKKFSWDDHARGIVRLIGSGESAAVAGRPPYRTARLFRIPVAKVTEEEAVERIVAMAREDRDSARPRRARLVATLNVDFVSNAVIGWPFGGNEELWGYLRNADLVTADGMPIVLLSKLLRDPLPARVTGADMVPAICRRFAEEGFSVYVLGGDRAAVEEAFAKLPPVRVAGIDPAFVKLDEDQPEIAERINRAKPDILFVALGNPKQELWMGRNAARLDVSAMIGIGGTFNFIAGKVKRAPRWMQRCGLEWIYRISQEPGRLWRRYAYGLVKFAWLSLRALAGGYK